MKKYMLLLAVLAFTPSFSSAQGLPKGCLEGYNFSPITGQSCKVIVVDCAPGHLFSSITGKSCNQIVEEKVIVPKKIEIKEELPSEKPSIVTIGGWANGVVQPGNILLGQFMIVTKKGYVLGEDINVNVLVDGKLAPIEVKKPSYIDYDSKSNVAIYLKNWIKKGTFSYAVTTMSVTDQNNVSVMYPGEIKGEITVK